MPTCPNCGEINNEGSKFCRECGYKLINENQNNPYEEYNPAYGKITRIVERKLDNSKLVDKLIDITTPKTVTSINTKHQGAREKLESFNEKYFDSIEPEFSEVCNTIEDDFLKSLFIIERSKYAGGGNIGSTILATVSTPTKHLSHEEAIQFYENLLNKVKHDLDVEKQKPNFNEREYYKKKYNEYFVENLSNMGVPRHLR